MTVAPESVALRDLTVNFTGDAVWLAEPACEPAMVDTTVPPEVLQSDRDVLHGPCHVSSRQTTAMHKERGCSDEPFRDEKSTLLWLYPFFCRLAAA